MDNTFLPQMKRLELDEVVHCRWRQCKKEIPAGPAWKEKGVERYFHPDTDCIDRYILDSGRKVTYRAVEIVYTLR